MEPLLRVKFVADYVLAAAKIAQEMKERINACTKWAKEEMAEWAPEKCNVLCMNQQDMNTQTLLLAEKQINNTRTSEYLVLNFTRDGLEETKLQTSMARGRDRIQELQNTALFNAGLKPAANRTLYQKYARSRITY